MATPDVAEEHNVLRQQNTELVQKVQYWKMLAGQRENEKIDLLKELNDVRLQLARIRNNGNVLASKLDAALESACKKALSNLVKASGEIASTMDIAKAYMRDRLEDLSPRWSAIGGTPSGEKVHRVPPMNIGGQSIHPVVSLSRTPLNTRPVARSPNQNRNVTERAVPMHMLQDVYIPLTRIDARANNVQMETEDNNSDDSADELGLEASGERSEIEESQQMSDENDDDDDDVYNVSRLDAVAEDLEPGEDEATPPRNSRIDNPLEGPSWLLDAPSSSNKSLPQPRVKLEPDSTTGLEETPLASVNVDVNNQLEVVACGSCVFTPTVRRRRKRTSTPPPVLYSPRSELSHRCSNGGRVLKVMVAKMRLDSLSPRSPAAKRAVTEQYDAPSPNGATVSGLIVSEADVDDFGASGEPHRKRRNSRRPSQPSHNHDSGHSSLESRRSSHDSRQSSHDSRQPSQDSRQPSHDLRQTGHELSLSGYDSMQTGQQSRQTGHDSRQIVHDLRQTGHDSRQTGHDSRQTGHDSRQTGHDSKQTGHDSRQTGHGSRQAGRASRRPSKDRESSMDESEGETIVQQERDSRSRSRRNDSRANARGDSRETDSGAEHGDGRSRRARNRVVSYQEKPLNRKLRR